MRLIDADALADEIAAFHPMDVGGSAIQAAVMAKVAAAPTVSDWIRVKDRLPENGQLVVVRYEVEGRIYSEVANYIMNLWWLDWDSNGMELNAISWLPIPEPPEDEE